MSNRWTDEDLRILFELRNEGYTRDQIGDELGRTVKSVEAAIKRYETTFESSDDTLAKTVLQARRSSKKSSELRKKVNSVADLALTQGDYISQLKDLSKSFKVSKQKITKKKKSKKKKNMTMELMLSDLHYGKLTDNFNSEVSRKRMSQLSNVFIEEMGREDNSFNVENVKILLLGDIIESK